MANLYSLNDKNVWVAGHNGMVGSAIVRRLEQENCTIITAGRNQLDLTKQDKVIHWVSENDIDAIIIAAAKVGGIHANTTYPAEFLHDNLMIAANIIEAAKQKNIEKLLFLGSSCIYPRQAQQPMKEEALLTGALEPTNEWYSIAKIAGIKLCQAYRQQYGCDFISGMPTNLYGPCDNFHPENSHVPAALLQRFHQAKTSDAPTVSVWGTGTPKREFLYSDDLADGCIFLMKNYSDNSHVNIGTGQAETIKSFANMIKNTVGYEGELCFDTSKPDGMPTKVMDVSKINDMGWKAKTSLQDGLQQYYSWFLENQSQLRK